MRDPQKVTFNHFNTQKEFDAISKNSLVGCISFIKETRALYLGDEEYCSFWGGEGYPEGSESPKTYAVTLKVKGYVVPSSPGIDPTFKKDLEGEVTITGATNLNEVPAGTELSVLAIPPRERHQGGGSSGYFYDNTPVNFIKMSIDGNNIVTTLNGVDISKYDSAPDGSGPIFPNGCYEVKDAFSSVGGTVVINSDTEILVEFCQWPMH